MFDNIKGQEKVKKLLTRVLNDGKIGHAYIFEGASGAGKLDMALAFAAAITGVDDVMSNPDIRIITNELYDSSKAEQKQLSVDTVRNMKAEVYIKPYGERKVYIIPNADTKTTASAFIAMQNSLLKVFEEPPGYCTIILLAENANMFLPTILSRAVVIKFSPLDKDEYMRYLLTDDSMATLREDVLKYMGQLMSGRYSAAYDFIAYAKKNKKSSGAILEIVGLYLNDLLHEQKIDMQTAVGMLDVYLKYHKMIAANGNYSACIECMLLGILDEVRRDR